MTKRVLVRCDAAPEIGFGHVVRCLALADELRNQHGCEVSFAMLQGPQGVEQVQEMGFTVHEPQEASLRLLDEGRWLQCLVSDTATQVLVLDIRTNLAIEAIQQIRAQGVLIVTIDDPSNRRLVADMAFYPPVPQVERLSWRGFTGKCFVGWDWVLLRPQFAEAARQHIPRAPDPLPEPRCVDRPLTLLVTMGGSDPMGLTLMALEAIERINRNFRVLVAIGGGFMHEPELNAWLATSKRSCEIRRDVSDMASLMAEADLAIASFGTTAYELATMGVPAVYLCLTDDHKESASAFVKLGISQCLGKHDEADSYSLADTILSVIEDNRRLKEVAAQASTTVDGCGAIRISKKILAAEEIIMAPERRFS